MGGGGGLRLSEELSRTGDAPPPLPSSCARARAFHSQPSRPVPSPPRVTSRTHTAYPRPSHLHPFSFLSFPSFTSKLVLVEFNVTPINLMQHFFFFFFLKGPFFSSNYTLVYRFLPDLV